MDDVKITQCKFSEAIVPYMYGELAAAECASFESHLLECGDCTDEFASISNARYEVYDWKKLEFDPLPTPPVRIPYADVSGVSWIERARSVFAGRWAFPAAGFAAVAIVSIFSVVFFTTGETGTDIALESGNTNSVETVMPSPMASERPAPVVSSPLVAREDLPDRKSERRDLKVATPSVSERKAVRREARSVQPKSVEARQATTRDDQRAVPRLNDFSDDEDTSLRLAELFEDVETRD